MERMTKRQLCERAYFRACSLPTSGSLSSDFASSTISGKPLLSSSRKSTKPLLVFSKSSPRPSRSDFLSVTLASSRMLAGPSPSSKNRHPAASSSLLILTRAVASFISIQPIYFHFESPQAASPMERQNVAIENTAYPRIQLQTTPQPQRSPHPRAQHRCKENHSPSPQIPLNHSSDNPPAPTIAPSSRPTSLQSKSQPIPTNPLKSQFRQSPSLNDRPIPRAQHRCKANLSPSPQIPLNHSSDNPSVSTIAPFLAPNIVAKKITAHLSNPPKSQFRQSRRANHNLLNNPQNTSSDNLQQTLTSTYQATRRPHNHSPSP